MPNSVPDARRPVDVAIVGAGIVGLSIAWAAARRGLSVVAFDPAPGEGACHHAAGMLAPVTEVHYGEEDILRLNLDAARFYPAFVSELEDASGARVGYRTTGTLAVAFDADDKAALDDLRAYQDTLGLRAQRLTGRECRRLEPFLAPSVHGGLLVEGDHQVDSRRLVAALLTACERAGVEIRRQPVTSIVCRADRVVGVESQDGELVAGQTVLAAGSWSGVGSRSGIHGAGPGIGGVPPEVLPPVRPVKGQILRLRQNPQAPLLTHTVRAFVKGHPIYLVPRTTGEVVAGGTVEEMGFDITVTAGAVYELLRETRELVPGLAEVGLAECSAGLRPGSPDNAPLIGPSAMPGLIVATGHYRNGILLGPITGAAVAQLLATGALPEGFAAFDPRRFAMIPSPAQKAVPA